MANLIAIRRKYDELTLQWQETLYQPVDCEVLRESAKFIQPQHYNEVIEERNVDNLCGYPICSKSRQQIDSNYRISLRAREVYDISELKHFCSRTCYVASKFFLSQLSPEPIYLRNLNKWNPVKVIPVGVDVRQMLAKETESTNQVDLGSEYVKAMTNNLPPAPSDIIIKENVNEAPAASVSYNNQAHDVVEGFRVKVPVKERRRTKKELPMTMFGKIWTTLDRITTMNTRMYFKDNKAKVDHTVDSDQYELMMTRINIFSEKILTSYNFIRPILPITVDIVNDLVDLMRTFKLDRQSVMLTETESNVLCMVFLHALSMNIPELHKNIFPTDDTNNNFRKTLESMGLTMEELEAFTRVIRVSST
ncbi:1708_t:CDS:2 [Paraglomus occultum]|uniref:RNA polymerase II subunit B1 CTD phosphatase RPAP2 homolog n=1 Tax=Paraglomus occultum TaxID=144539 RepID=A0A9N9CAQ3_9GLOM|nr:1708_t:CDS:2 [Paraglomus occultum]